MLKHSFVVAVVIVWNLLSPSLREGLASDWPRFRGPNGSGVSPDEAPAPTTWSDTENLKWKVALPGPGSSSPIVVGQRVYVTCWDGYGVDGQRPEIRRICAGT